MTRRVKVSVELETGIARSELRSGQLGAVEVLTTEGSAWAVSRLVVAMPEHWQVTHPVDDFRHAELVLAIVREEFRKRDWKVDGICVTLESRR